MVYKGVKCPDCNIGPVVEYGLVKARCENCGRVIDLSKIDPRVRPELEPEASEAEDGKGFEIAEPAQDQAAENIQVLDIRRGASMANDAVMALLEMQLRLNRTLKSGQHAKRIHAEIYVEGEGGDGN